MEIRSLFRCRCCGTIVRRKVKTDDLTEFLMQEACAWESNPMHVNIGADSYAMHYCNPRRLGLCEYIGCEEVKKDGD